MVSETVAGIGATVSTRVGATVGDRSAMVPAAEGPTEGGTIAGIDATATFFHSATVSRLGGFAALVVATVSWGAGAMVSETVAGTGATVSTRVGATVGDRSAMVPAAEGPTEGGTIAGIDATATFFHSATVSRLGELRHLGCCNCFIRGKCDGFRDRCGDRRNGFCEG